MARVVVAMSGGVDSSVTALLMKQAGHEVIGVFMRHGHQSRPEGGVDSCNASERPARKAHRQGCCSADDAADARRVASMLGIAFYALNFEDAFEPIIEQFVQEYASGRTPNPCVRCNTHLKFGRLWQYAQAVEADYIATGHYARLIPGPEGPELHRGQDAAKDQSYVLFGVNRERLGRVLLPVGCFEKARIRELARDAGLPVGDKPDSYEICFVTAGHYAELVRERAPQAFEPGPIVEAGSGRVLGEHRGLPSYTVGQRHGLGVSAAEPLYVTEINVRGNRLIVGRKPQTLRSRVHCGEANWLSISPPVSGCRVYCQVRSNGAAHAGRIELVDAAATAFCIAFDEPAPSVAPGQAAVVYDAQQPSRVLGGGWIERAE